MDTTNNNDIFNRKARGTNISRQAQRVYLCFDQTNINELNILIDDILSQDAGMDCVVTWKNDFTEISRDNIQNELQETQVVIVWVTNSFLNSIKTNGIPLDFTLATEQNIPILPIAQDEGLLPIFTDIVSKLHGIAMNDPEYRTKLKAQLENFLASENLKEQIDSKAFTAEIFLSYRKVDLEDARKFMREIHNIEGLQGISIWYDHFLTAGREFDVEIREAIENSTAFVLLVTPNITKKNEAGELNYVAREEVPFAIKKEKKIIPVEVKPRDSATFAVIFPNIDEPVSVSILNKAFREKLGDSAYIKSLGSERSYLLGMAYLRGHKVERDIERAIKLLEEAANHKDKFSLAATEQLAKIHEEGLGGNITINFNTALFWWQKAADLSKRINGRKHQLTATIYNKIGIIYYKLGDYKKALEFHDKALKIYLIIFGKEHSETGITYNFIGKVYIKLEKTLGIGVLYDALKIFQKNYGENHPYTAGAYLDIGINHIENKMFITLHSIEDSIYKLGDEEKNVNKGAEYALNNIAKALAIYKNIYGDNHYYTAIAYNYLGKVYLLIGDYDNAFKNLNLALNIMNNIYGEEHLYSSYIYKNLGLLHKQLGEYEKALHYFDKVLNISKKYFEEDNINITSFYKDIGEVYLQFGKYNEAIEYFIKDVDLLIKNYDDDKENIKVEKKALKTNKKGEIYLKSMSKGIWLPIFIFLFKGIIKLPLKIILLPVKIIKNIPKSINFIKGITSLKKSLNKKNAKGEDNFEGFGTGVYSMFSSSDKQSVVNITLKNIKEKYIFIADLYYKNEDFGNALKYYIFAMEFKKRSGTDGLVEEEENLLIYFKIGKLFLLLNNIDSSFEYCNKALVFYDHKVKLKIMHDKNKGKKKKKEEEDQDDDNEIDNDLNNNNIVELFNTLGKVCSIQKNLQKALEYFNKAIEICNVLPDEDTASTEEKINIRDYIIMVNIYIEIAHIYKELNEYDKVLMNYNKALESLFFNKNDDSSLLNNIINEIVEILNNDKEGKFSHFDTIMFYYGANILTIKINKFNKSLDINMTVNSDKDEDLAKLYYFAGNIYKKINDEKKSDDSFSKALEYYQKVIDNKNDDDDDDDYKERAELLSKILSLQIIKFGEEHENTANTYYEIGYSYYQLEDTKKAKEYQIKCLDIRKKVLGNNHRDTATSYISVGNRYWDEENYEKALEHYKQALVIRQKIFGEDHAYTAFCHNEVAETYEKLEDNEMALQHYEAAVNSYKISTPKEHKKHIKLYKRILELQKIIYGEEDAKTAFTYNAIGVSYSWIGNINKELEYYTKSLEIRKKLLGDDAVETAISYSNTGISYKKLGEYEKGLELQKKALEIGLKLLGEDHSRTAYYYEMLGDNLEALNKLKEALECYQKGMNIIKKYKDMDIQLLTLRKKALKMEIAVNGEDNIDITYLYSLISKSYARIKEYDNALQNAIKALEIRKKILGEEDAKTVQAYLDVGVAYKNLKSYDESIKNYQTAFDIAKKINDNQMQGKAYHYLGVVYGLLNNYIKAIEYHEFALELYKTVFPEDHKDIIQVMENIGYYRKQIKEE